MIELAKKFVSATDEVWRLQRGEDPECVFFQRMANQGHYKDRPGGSRQGIYVCAPSGKLLASINSTDPIRVVETLQQGLKLWQALPDAERRLDANARIRPKHRWEDSYPADGLVLTMYTRDLSADTEPNEPDQRSKWNQDPVWFSQAEARTWLPPKLEVGAEQELPTPLAMRLARLHLVDTVKGQTSTFAANEVEEIRIVAKVVTLTDEVAKIELKGQSHAADNRPSRRTSPNGVKTQMLGSAVFDLDSKRFQEFELVAVGTRWGYTRFNGRHHESKESRLGFVFRLTKASAPRIAPAFISQYNVDWVKRPE